jgi:hypothetical protein
MMALLAGWQGTGIGGGGSVETEGPALRVQNPCTGTAALWLTAESPAFAEVSMYSADGRLLCVPFSGPVAAGTSRIDVHDLAPGLYLVMVRTGGLCLTSRLVSLGQL